MTAVLSIKNRDGTLLSEEDILSFNFIKDIYTPYTSLSAKVRTSRTNFDNAAEVMLAIDNSLIHHGLIDDLKIEKTGGEYFLSVTSRGFTSLLCQNQIEPGLKMNISFNMLMDNFYTLPYVTHENNSDDSSYIYVRPNTSMWDAASNLAYKLLGTYPYIRGTNTVMISPFPAPEVFDFTDAELISHGTELACRHIASDYHMADINGNYGTFDLTDPDAAALKIVRHKYFDLDMRFLYAPQQALYFRDKFDFRGQKMLFCSYSGFCGEDLYDLVSFTGVTAERIGSIKIRGSSKGIFTETGVYRDKFPH
ncbi:hypothetical protein [Ruminococcus flavefaciens]|uniref:Uncharacterized protein n=1 Tax=Ruminococcus flavefaciens TaxID=1265 RepID=A0A1M7LCF9_RUMFL|nr:hypothetical protein [Ruminococcus flavefaciens]SHM75038.1 hypothetical protein SAMN04487860_11286 [Ruminococcus flavefaciens]